MGESHEEINLINFESRMKVDADGNVSESENTTVVSNSSSLCEIISKLNITEPVCETIVTPDIVNGERPVPLRVLATKDYETLLSEAHRKIREQEEKFQKRVIHLTTDYEVLKQSLEENISCLKERISILEDDSKRKDEEITRLSNEKNDTKE